MIKSSSSNTLQAFWILIGSFSAFGFSVISSMILSRYFEKHDYGTYRQVMYVYNTLLVVFTLGLPMAYSYFLPRVERVHAKQLISKINAILMLSGALMSILLFTCAGPIAVIMRNEDLYELIRYFSPVPFFLLPTMGLEGILSTYRRTKYVAIYNVFTRILMLLCVTVPVYFFSGTVQWAIIGFSVASFISFICALYLKYLPLRTEPSLPSPIGYDEIMRYAIPLMLAGTWGVVIKSADQFFISRYFGSEVFADFANGSLELPFVAMVVSASSVVLAPIFSKRSMENTPEAMEEIIRLWRSVFNKSVKLVYPMIVFTICFPDLIMVVLYGEKYATSGIYFQIKLFVNFFTLITYSPLLLSIGGNRFYYRVHAYGALILIGLEWASVLVLKSPVAITAISVACHIGRIMVMLAYVARYLRLSIIDLIPWRLIGSLVVPSVIFNLLTKKLLLLLGFGPLMVIVFSLMLYLMFFFVLVHILDIEYRTIVQPVMERVRKIVRSRPETT